MTRRCSYIPFEAVGGSAGVALVMRERRLLSVPQADVQQSVALFTLPCEGSTPKKAKDGVLNRFNASLLVAARFTDRQPLSVSATQRACHHLIGHEALMIPVRSDRDAALTTISRSSHARAPTQRAECLLRRDLKVQEPRCTGTWVVAAAISLLVRSGVDM